MSKLIVVLAALLSVVGLVGAPLAGAGEVTSGAGPVPQIVAFDNEEFLGDHIHIFGNMKDLGKWGNSISSMVILAGTWEFFDDEDFTGTSLRKLGPGAYADVTKHGLKNNSISSVRLASPGAASLPWRGREASGRRVPGEPRRWSSGHGTSHTR